MSRTVGRLRLQDAPTGSIVKIVDLVYINAGGGHRSAAVAIDTVVRKQARPWQIRMVNLFEVLDPGGVFEKTTGMKPETYYNSRLKRGWTLGFAQELRVLQAIIRLGHRSITAQLQRHWQEASPDIVVSLVPNFNRAMYQALSALRPRIPLVTVMTDFADFPPHFWIEPKQPQHFICGTPRAVAQARAMGHDEARIHRASGMIIRPDFYEPLRCDRRAERLRLKLDPDRPTGIVMFGGHGSKTMKLIAKQLHDTQLICICGHNAALAAQLRAMPAAAPRVIVEFTAEIRYYMYLSDFFIGKPGPGSLSEAIQQGLPVIVVRNAWTLPQERYNTEWVRENRVGVVLDSFKSVRSGVAQIVGALAAWRANVGAIHNRAIFEIPEILAGLLARGQDGGLGPENAIGVAPLTGPMVAWSLT
jgi:UDP-N-acetylglucosamine:LPS N-acetylglucosamine transferase